MAKEAAVKEEFTPHELALMEKMTPENQVLMNRLTTAERRSLENNVTLGNIELVQRSIHSDKEIENTLFWDRGGKFDNPIWKSLKPVDHQTHGLFIHAEERLQILRSKAVEIQRRSDLTLHSQFNSALLFTGLSGAARCRADGTPEDQGEFYKGIEFRCVGSVEDEINSVTIYPIGSAQYEVHYGTRIKDKDQGISCYAGDSFSQIQLAQINKRLIMSGFKTVLTDQSGNECFLDPKTIRQAAQTGEALKIGEELILHSSDRTVNIEEAIEKAISLSMTFYERYGLETECYNIGKIYGNFFIMRNENFSSLLPNTPVDNTGLVIFTATVICRRCRREIEGFRNLARDYRDIHFAIVNLEAPHLKFHERVFGDMAGGDPNTFRSSAVGVTPFVIIYAPDEKGILTYREYYGTKKDQPPPSLGKIRRLLDKHFQHKSRTLLMPDRGVLSNLLMRK